MGRKWRRGKTTGRRRRLQKIKEQKIWVWDPKKGKLVKVSTRDPNYEWVDGVFTRKPYM